PDHRTVALPERHHRLSWSSDAANDRVAIRNRAAGVPGLDHRAYQQLGRVELFDEVVRPEDLACALLERKQLLVRANREEAIANDERGRVWAGAKAEIFPSRRVRVLPDGLAGLGVERDDGLF